MASTSADVKPLRLQDINENTGFPQHIHALLNQGSVIPFPEIFCRLIHVCMVEVGFAPIIDDDDHEFTVEELINLDVRNSMLKFTKDLKTIVDRTGSAHNVTYKAIMYKEQLVSLSQENSVENIIEPESRPGTSSNVTGKDLEKTIPSKVCDSIPVVATESGDESSSARQASVSSPESLEQMSYSDYWEKRWSKVLSDDISVIIIHDGYDMQVVANGQGFQKNVQVPINRYIRTIQQLPTTAKAEDYLKIINFSAIRFAEDVKKKFCHQIMDEIDGISFDIRSLAWLPPEIIVEVAKRCSPLSVFRLRATCVEIRNALSANNHQFWKMMLKRDFPHCNMAQLNTDTAEDKYYRKYSEMCNFTIRRPLRRTLGRIFPFYLLNNFRP